MRLPPAVNWTPLGSDFCGLVVNNNTCVCDSSVAWNLFDLVMCQHEDGVGAWHVGGCVALCKVSEFLAKGPGPRFVEEWVVL